MRYRSRALRAALLELLRELLLERLLPRREEEALDEELEEEREVRGVHHAARDDVLEVGRARARRGVRVLVHGGELHADADDLRRGRRDVRVVLLALLQVP